MKKLFTIVLLLAGTAGAQTNAFFDHFEGGGLNARWTQVTSGTPTVSFTDSYWGVLTPATADAAFIYTTIDKTRSQVIEISANNVNTATGSWLRVGWIVNRTSVPVAAGLTTFEADARIMFGFRNNAGTMQAQLAYFDTGHTVTNWNGTAWSTTQTGTTAGADNYFRFIIEIDAANARFRMGLINKDPNGTTYTFDEGYRIMALSDWVDFTSLESTSDTLYLVLGEPSTSANPVAATERRFEYVRLLDGTRYDAWGNGKTNVADKYDVRHYYGYGDENNVPSFMLPQDRTTIAITPAVGENAKTPSVLQDGATYYMAFTESLATGGWAAKIADATSPDGPWTVRGIIVDAGTVDTDERIVHGMQLIKDVSEPSAAKRYKLLYSTQNNSTNEGMVRLATSGSLPNVGGWTKQGIAIDHGAASDFDEKAAQEGFAYWDGSQWVVFYCGRNGALDSFKISYATTPNLNTLPYTKSGNILLGASATPTEALTADLTSGRTVTVADSAGFAQDGWVVLSDSGTADNYAVAKVRKVPNGTSIELYEEVVAFTTANSAQIGQADSFAKQSLPYVMKVGATFYMFNTPFPHGFSGTPNPFNESNGLVQSSTLTSGYTWNWRATPFAPKTDFGWERSAENLTFVNQPIISTLGSAVIGSCGVTAIGTVVIGRPVTSTAGTVVVCP